MYGNQTTTGCATSMAKAPAVQPDRLIAELEQCEKIAHGIRATANMIAENISGSEPVSPNTLTPDAGTIVSRLSTLRGVLQEAEYNLSRTTRAIPL